MTIAPDARLVRIAAVLVLGSVATVVAPGLSLAWIVAVAFVVAATLWEAWQILVRPPLIAERVLPERGALGIDATVTLRLRSDASTTTRVTVIDECPPDLTPTEPTFHDVVLPPRSVREWTYRIRPTLRGNRPYGPLLTLEAGPLGLLRRRSTHGAGAVLPVFPHGALAATRHTLHIARRIAEVGLRPDRRRGSSLELESLRDYVPGDDPRHLDWAASLRRGRLVTRHHQRERDQTLLVGVDTSRLMAARVGVATKLDLAVDAALALVVAGLVGGDRVGAFAFDRRVHGWTAPRATRRHLAPILGVLGLVQPADTEVGYEAVAREVRRRQSRRAMVVLFTDLVDAGDDLLLEPLRVLGRHHRVVVVAIRDPFFEALDPRTPLGASLDPYERIAVDFLRRGRDAAIGRARRAGVDTLDLAPTNLTAPVLDRYLSLRSAPL